MTWWLQAVAGFVAGGILGAAAVIISEGGRRR